MPRIKPVHWKVLECIFQKDGFVFERQVGDHRSYFKVGTLRSIVIPTYKEIDVDIIRGNMRTARMDRIRYFELLRVCKKKS
jgi:predicted RNA binding protein YcfA (HicA-like mRNA interferase family)